MTNKKSFFFSHPKKTLVFFVIASILVLDIVIGSIYYWLERDDEKVYRTASKVFHHSLKPNTFTNRARWGHFYKVYTNSLGFKDQKIRTVALQSPKHRVLFVGDSFTEGIGVEYDSSFVGVVAKHFKKQNIEVHNAAVVSYSPVIYYTKIKYLLTKVKFKFNHLVAFIDLSDIQDEALYYDLDKNNCVIAKSYINVKISPLMKSRSFLLKNTILTRAIVKKIWRVALSSKEKEMIKNARIRKHERGRWSIDQNVYKKYGWVGLLKAGKYMEKLNALLKQRQITLTLAIYPWPQEIKKSALYSRHRKYWLEWAKTHQIPLLDYYPHFIKKGLWQTAKPYFFEGDVHWNVKGHKLVAGILIDYLMQEYPTIYKK